MTLAVIQMVSQADVLANLAQARQLLDDDHFGLEEVKKRILEFLAVRKLPVLMAAARRWQALTAMAPSTVLAA